MQQRELRLKPWLNLYNIFGCRSHLFVALVQTWNFTCADFNANDENLLVPAHLHQIRQVWNATLEPGLRFMSTA